ncbi:hypothetical protein MTO96_043976 [Rhipicephalus appendiculatus]
MPHTRFGVSARTSSQNPWKNTAKQSPPRPRWLSSDGSDDSEDEDEEWPSLHPEKFKKKPRGRLPSRSTMRTKKPKGTSRSQSRSRSRRRDADVGTPNPKPHSLQLNHKSRAPGNTAENIDHAKVGCAGGGFNRGSHNIKS